MTGNDHQAARAQLSTDIDAAALQKAEEYIEQEEGAAIVRKGGLAVFITLTAGVRHVFRLYTAEAIVATPTPLLAIIVVVYAIQGGDDFTDRNTSPMGWDIALGIVLILLVLEGMRRTSGWVMPVICVLFLLYALGGPWLPAPWTHKGYDVGR